MSYKTPIVCKEVYLPYHREEISFDDYKKLTGIDILEVFDIKKDSLNADSVVRKPNCKYYIVVDDERGFDFDSTGSYAIPNGTYELLAYISDPEDVIFSLYFAPCVNINSANPMILITNISISQKKMLMANEL